MTVTKNAHSIGNKTLVFLQRNAYLRTHLPNRNRTFYIAGQDVVRSRPHD